eukprot:tig00000319_g24125.t1
MHLPEPEPVSISSLPSELLLHVFSFLDTQAFGRCCCVCKQWKGLALESNFWEIQCRKIWADCSPAALKAHNGSWRDMLGRRPRLSRVGYATDRGRRDENKDSYQVMEFHGVFGIFHGHGDYGAIASEFVAQKLPIYLQNEPELTAPGDLEKAVIQAFRGVEAEFSRRPKAETDTSGTSALAVVFRDREVVIANVGGSEAVLGRARPPNASAATGNSGGAAGSSVTGGGSSAAAASGSSKAAEMVYETVQLSHSHLTYVRPDERERVRQAGGRVENDYVHPMYSAGYGLVLTRSIGDEILKPWGVTAEPELWRHTWKAEDKFIIMATRELWKFVFATDAVDIVRRSRHPKEAAEALVREARGLGAPGNITAIVIEPYSPASMCAAREARELPTAREARDLSTARKSAAGPSTQC